MGKTFDAYGRRCCDRCDERGGVRTRTCPHRVYYPAGGSLPYCAAPALCSKCYAEVKALLHKDCKAGAAKSQAAVNLRAERLAAGEYEVSAAFGDWHKDVPNGTVGLCFRNRDGLETFRLVRAHSYKRGGYLSDYPDALPWDVTQP